MLSPSEQRFLHLALADLASGTPRQWWHLEIAARLGPAGKAGPWARLLALLLRAIGLNSMAPLLARAGLHGMAPYAALPDDLARDGTVAARLSLIALCMLVAVESLNVSRRLAILLLAALGGAVTAGIAYRRAAGRTKQQWDRQALMAGALTPSESSLGLAALLVSADLPLHQAQALAEQWATQPDSADRAMLERLGMLAPCGTSWTAMQHGLTWLLATAAVGWAAWLTSTPWQLVPALLGAGLVHFVVQGHQPGWVRPAVRTVVYALLAGTLALLWRH
jgi:hypothetical protein